MLKLNPYKIGFRTIKTAVGMTLGVIISKLLGLDNYASSAILVYVLNIQKYIRYKRLFQD
ncbi:aromatic acid exporter family protein [Staphylococcus aureus]